MIEADRNIVRSNKRYSQESSCEKQDLTISRKFILSVQYKVCYNILNYFHPPGVLLESPNPNIFMSSSLSQSHRFVCAPSNTNISKLHSTLDQRESSINSMVTNTGAKLDSCRNAIIEMHAPIETRLTSSIPHLINRAVLKRDGRARRDARLNLALSRIHRREADWERGRIQADFSQVGIDVIFYCFKKAG